MNVISKTATKERITNNKKTSYEKFTKTLKEWVIFLYMVFLIILGAGIIFNSKATHNEWLFLFKKYLKISLH
jgi:membrane peptidoglycan carboxypeptidase